LTRAQPLGVVGFSMGGYFAFVLATERPTDLKAAAIFYGLKKADFRKTQTAFLGHFAEDDPWNDVEDVHDVETRLLDAGKDATFYVYPGTTHWFFEKNQKGAYHSKAAQLAWKRTASFLKQTLLTE
jgi:carboxymethylenebutenolidase